VHSFEFDSDNLEVLRRNLGLNPALASCIRVVPSALWDRAGEWLHYSPAGAATTVTAESAAGPAVQTVTIDGYVVQTNLPRVDYIKLDIEGAELKALQGAEQSLRRWRPTLAIALYHRLRDFVDIPEYLADLRLDYRLYLGHFTIHAEETILFATAADRR
jgi:FkbM family methyltransferase